MLKNEIANLLLEQPIPVENKVRVASNADCCMKIRAGSYVDSAFELGR